MTAWHGLHRLVDELNAKIAEKLKQLKQSQEKALDRLLRPAHLVSLDQFYQSAIDRANKIALRGAD